MVLKDVRETTVWPLSRIRSKEVLVHTTLFRGESFRSQKPNPEDAIILEAGGNVTLEITCHPKFTTWGNETSSPSYKYNACPGGLGRYHADIHHPENETVVNPLLLAGCAIAISDTTNIEEVTAENLTIISVQSQCVMNKFATFAIPATLPACTGGYCICSWHWLAKEGLGNSQMSGFLCKVNAKTNAYEIGVPKAPRNCTGNVNRCQYGAKQPMFPYNLPYNVPNVTWRDGMDEMAFMNWKPTYGSNFGFWTGAQSDAMVLKAGSKKRHTLAKRLILEP